MALKWRHVRTLWHKNMLVLNTKRFATGLNIAVAIVSSMVLLSMAQVANVHVRFPCVFRSVLFHSILFSSLLFC